jgi:hypothetical protein
MRSFVIALAGVATSLVAWPSSAQVWVEKEVRRPPHPVVEREVIVREPAWAACRMVVDRHYRPDGTVVIRKVRRC